MCTVTAQILDGKATLKAIKVELTQRVARLREQGIGVQVHYVPVHHHTVSADVLLPATTSFEIEDLSSSYGSMAVLPVEPVTLSTSCVAMAPPVSRVTLSTAPLLPITLSMAETAATVARVS